MTRAMDVKILRALIEAGAVKRVRIIGEGSFFHIEVNTQGGSSSVNTLKGTLKSWGSLDAAAKWIHSLGIGTCQVELSRWQPGQKGMKL